MFPYKFFLCPIFMVTALLGYLLGGIYLWSGFLFILVIGFLGDGILPLDTSDYTKKEKPWFADMILYFHLPIAILINIIFAWHLAPHDPLGLGQIFQDSFGLSLLESKKETGIIDLIGGFLTMGFVYGVGCTNVAHELVHRIRNKKSVAIGRWLLGFTFDTSFSIEHVFGHHNKVATQKDASSARRGESSWSFIYRSTKESLISSWNIEKNNIIKKRKPLLSFHNTFITGQIISLTYLLMYFFIAGKNGALTFILMAFYGKAYLEFINYIEHYGLIREPGEKIELRHSWNSNHALSSYLLYNLPRHSYHHISSIPYWKIKNASEAPELPHGYLIMIFLSMFPSLFEKKMKKKLQDWDLKFANQYEQSMAREANLKAKWSIDHLPPCP